MQPARPECRAGCLTTFIQGNMVCDGTLKKMLFLQFLALHLDGRNWSQFSLSMCNCLVSGNELNFDNKLSYLKNESTFSFQPA
jgi:hypothetical protein